MNIFPTFPAERRQLLCEEAQGRLGLSPVSIEKDFWVCWILRDLFGLPIFGEHLVFKGGTSLSKGWKLISRFSEDIDIVINRNFLGFGGDSLSNKRQNKLKMVCRDRVQNDLRPTLEKRLRETIPNGLGWELISADATEDPDLQTLLFLYPSGFPKGASYIRPIVKIEFGARSETEPIEIPQIRPYLAEAFPELLKDSDFPIPTVAARRTFWEKAMLLHEEAFRPAGRFRKAGLSRHYYDLWCLIRAGVGEQAAADLELFERVARHRRTFFKKSWVNYKTLCKGQLRLTPGTNQIGEWEHDYKAMRSEMFFNDPPIFSDILDVIRMFENEFNEG
jgi:hypothetical protein